MEMLEIILKIMGGFAIPSIGWNIYQYFQNKKYKKWEAERELKKAHTNKQKVELEFENENRKLDEKYRGTRSMYVVDTFSESFGSWESEQNLLQERKNYELDSIDADIEFFKKLSGQ